METFLGGYALIGLIFFITTLCPVVIKGKLPHALGVLDICTEFGGYILMLRTVTEN